MKMVSWSKGRYPCSCVNNTTTKPKMLSFLSWLLSIWELNINFSLRNYVVPGSFFPLFISLQILPTIHMLCFCCVSHSVMFDPLTPWIVSSVHGILQERILEWVAIPFSRGDSQPRGQTRVSCIVGRFFTIWATRKAIYTGEEPNFSAWLIFPYMIWLLLSSPDLCLSHSGLLPLFQEDRISWSFLN